MQKKINKETSELIVSVEAKKENWIKKIENAKNNLIKNLSIKGFRKGNVPADIAAKHVTEQDVWSKALPKMLDELIKQAANKLTEEDKKNIIGGASYKIDKISATELEVSFIYPVFPQIDLGDYKSHGVKYKVDKVDEVLIQNDIKKLQLRHAMIKEKDGETLEKGDVAIFDFEGKVDGKSFEGGKSENYELEIGSGQFIAGFEDQMIGLKKGEKKNITVTFPKDYHVENLKGKSAIFKIKINNIKIKELPKLDDSFAKDAGIKDVNTLPELKKYIKNILEKQSEQVAKQKFQRDVFAKLKSKIEIKIPTQLIAQETQQQQKMFLDRLNQTLKAQGGQAMKIQDYIKMTGTKEEELIKQFREEAQKRLETAFIFATISKAEKIELTDSDYEKEYEKAAKVYGQTIDAIKNTITKEQLQIPMINDKVIEILIKGKKIKTKAD